MPIQNIKSTVDALQNTTILRVIREGFEIEDANNKVISDAFDSINGGTETAEKALAKATANEISINGIKEVDNRQDNAISKNEAAIKANDIRDSQQDDDIRAAKAYADKLNQALVEADEQLKGQDVNGVVLNFINKKSLSVDITKNSGEEIGGNTIDMPFINTATLIPGTNEHTFKIHFEYKDGSSYDTNDLVMPGSVPPVDVAIQSIIMGYNTAGDSINVKLILDDKTEITSNDLPLNIPGITDAFKKVVKTSTDKVVILTFTDVGGVEHTANIDPVTTQKAGILTTTQYDNLFKKNEDITYNQRLTFGIAPFVPDINPSEYESQRAVNVKQVHAAFVNVDNNITDVIERVTTLETTEPVKSVVNSVSDAGLVTTVNGVASTPIQVGGGVKVSISGIIGGASLKNFLSDLKIGDRLFINFLTGDDTSVGQVNLYDVDCILVDTSTNNRFNFKVIGGYSQEGGTKYRLSQLNMAKDGISTYGKYHKISNSNPNNWEDKNYNITIQRIEKAIKYVF